MQRELQTVSIKANPDSLEKGQGLNVADSIGLVKPKFLCAGFFVTP